MAEPSRGERRAVLIIDDSPTVLRVMEAVLLEAGYSVTCLESGRDAVTWARRTKPALIIVDFAMPEISGYAVCRELGRDPITESTPVILMTTRGDAIGDRFVRELGVVDHITKPFAPEALLALVEHVLSRGPDKRPREAVATAFATPPHDQVAERELACRLAMALAEDATEDTLEERLQRALGRPQVVEALNRLAPHAKGPVVLRGDLAAIPMAEVLQLLSLQRQTGVLRIRDPEREVAIFLKDGQVRLVTGNNLSPDLLLGSILVQEKLISKAELDQLISNRRGSRRLIGSQIVQLGYVTRDDLHKALRRQSSELIYELLRWDGGQWHFERCAALPAEVLDFEFGVSIDALLMEGFRRVDEWGLIEGVLKSFAVVPNLVPGGVAHLGDSGLTEEESTLVDAIDGARSVHELIRVLGMPAFEVARLLYRLACARVVNLPDTTPMPLEDQETLV